MRILALTEESDRSETALFIGLKRAGIEVHVYGSVQAERALELSQAGISAQSLHCRSKIDLLAIRAIRTALREHSFDIVHAFTSRFLSNALFASIGLPARIITYRGTTGHVSRIDPTSWITYLNPRIAAISCVSEAVRNYLHACGVPIEKLSVIYKGHDVGWYRSDKPSRFAELGIPLQAFVISCVANMRAVKGVDILITAAQKLIDQYQDSLPIHVLLIGEIRDPVLLRLKKQAHPNIHFTGFRSDASELVSSSSIYVQPSRAREGLPKAVIEAMAQGLPVVVSNAGGLPELVRHEIDGLVCQADDSSALRQALHRLIQDRELQVRLGNNARQRIQNDFSVQKTIDSTIALYGRVL